MGSEKGVRTTSAWEMMTSQSDNEVFEQSSFLFGANSAFIEKLYADYQANPASVDASWQQFFASLGETDGALKQPAWQRPDWPPHRQW